VANPKVTVSYVHPNEVSASFHECLIAMLMWDAGHHGFLLHDHGKLAVRCGTNGLIEARNQVVEAFLKSDSEWLFWIDADMGFKPDSLDGLMMVAHPEARPIIGGLCFASKEYSTDGMAGHRAVPKPTIYQRAVLDGKLRHVAADWYPVNRLLRCDATGAAFVLIHRRVLERMKTEHGTWYDRLHSEAGTLLGEDISFCVRAEELGVPVHVHTGIRTTHHKPQWVQEADFWKAYQPPPATEQVAVIVPVMKRPQSAEPFMKSLRASTGLATVYAVCDPEDSETYTAWLTAGAEVLVSDRGSSFAQKANCGYEKTSEPWLLLVGDDVKFHPGWFLRCIRRRSSRPMSSRQTTSATRL
jgi:hypothetical protein